MSLAQRTFGLTSVFATLSYFAFLTIVGAADNRTRQDEKLAALSKGKAGSKRVEKLTAGGIQAKILSDNLQTPHSAGAYIFTEIEVQNTTFKNEQTAEIFLEPDGAEIHAISGKNIDYNPKKDSRTVKILKLKKGKSVNVLVELRLKQSLKPQNDKAQSRLKITLRQSDKNGSTISDSTSLAWLIENCAADYHSELVKIHDENANLLKEIIPKSRTRKKSLPGRWLFSSRARTSKARGRCLKSRLVYSTRRDRYYRRCVKYAWPPARSNSSSSAKTSAEQAKIERKIYRMANRFVQMRGIDPELRTTRDSGWVTRRVSIDLRAYLGQKPNPAICSGAIRMVDYFDKRLGDVRKRAAELDELTFNALKFARERTQRINDTLSEASGGHPGFGQLPLSAIGKKVKQDSNLSDLIAYAGNLYAQMAQLDPPEETEDIFQSLAEIKQMLRRKPQKEIPPEFKSAQLNAFSMIEAAAYLNLVNEHYNDLRKSIDGSLASIRSAHKQTCTCKN